MALLPLYEETIFSTLSKDEVLRRLKITVKHSALQNMQHEKLGDKELEVYLFNGLVSENGFSISLVLEKPENFYPLINGTLLEDDQGSLIKLRFQLFNSVKVFYFFWTAFLSAFLLVSIFHTRSIISICSCLLIQLITYAVIRNKFNTGVKKSRKEILRLIG